MVEVRAFQPSDLTDIPRERLADPAHPFLIGGYLEELRRHGPAYTLRIDGQVYLAGGIAEEPGTGARWLWSFVTMDSGPHMRKIHREVLRFIHTYPGPLLAASARSFAAGCRWLTMLGFQPVANPSGLPDHQLFARE